MQMHVGCQCVILKQAVFFSVYPHTYLHIISKPRILIYRFKVGEMKLMTSDYVVGTGDKAVSGNFGFGII